MSAHSATATIGLSDAAPIERQANAARARRRRLRHTIGLPALSFLLVGVIWQLAAWLGLIDVRFFSSPIEVLGAGLEIVSEPAFWVNSLATVSEYLIGFVLGAVIGVPLGVFMGWKVRLRQTLEPFMTALYVSPTLVLMPVVVLMFGIGPASKIFLVLLETVLMVAISAMAGIRQVDPDLVRAARSMSASSRKIFSAVLLPGSLVSVMTGLRLAAGRANHVVIVAELYGGVIGLGTMIHAYGNAFAMPELLFLVGVVGMAGYIVAALLRALESRVSASMGMTK